MTEGWFTPPYPLPHRSKLSFIRRFFCGRHSWIHTLFEKSYTMKMGEVRLPRLDFFIVNELALVCKVLEEDGGNFPKHHLLRALLDPLIGESVFSANGEAWAHQRKMVNPSFAHTNLNKTFDSMDQAVRQLVERLQARDPAAPVPIDALMTQVTGDIMFRTLFSRTLDDAAAERIYTAFNAYQRHVQPGILLKIYRLPLLGARRKLARAAQEIHAVFAPLVRERYMAFHGGQGAAQDDILHALLSAKHPAHGGGFTVEEVINQVSTLFLAGHETTASALTWALYLLACCPELQEALRAEIGEGEIGFDDMRRLTHTRNVFRETLRLYPPVSFLLREVTAPTEMRGKWMRRGAMVVISPWLIHRSKLHWRCPHAFHPNRFEEPEAQETCKQAYLPFGRGPRACVGAGFAQQEAVLILAHLVRHFSLRNPEGQAPEPVSRLTLRPRGGIRLFFTPRPAR